MHERSYTSLGPPLTAQQLAQHLAFVPRRLPEEYLAFLLATNGARPKPDTWYGDDLATSFGVHTLLGVTRRIETSNIGWKYQSCLAKNIPMFLPIASDDLGNFVLMSLRDHDLGTIHFWDYCADYALDTGETITRIADSFVDFVSGLREYEE